MKKDELRTWWLQEADVVEREVNYALLRRQVD